MQGVFCEAEPRVHAPASTTAQFLHREYLNCKCSRHYPIGLLSCCVLDVFRRSAPSASANILASIAGTGQPEMANRFCFSGEAFNNILVQPVINVPSERPPPPIGSRYSVFAAVYMLGMQIYGRISILSERIPVFSRLAIASHELTMAILYLQNTPHAYPATAQLLEKTEMDDHGIASKPQAERIFC